MKDAQKHYNTFLETEYQKEMLKTTHVVAKNSKLLFDAEFAIDFLGTDHGITVSFPDCFIHINHYTISSPYMHVNDSFGHSPSRPGVLHNINNSS